MDGWKNGEIEEVEEWRDLRWRRDWGLKGLREKRRGYSRVGEWVKRWMGSRDLDGWRDIEQGGGSVDGWQMADIE